MRSCELRLDNLFLVIATIQTFVLAGAETSSTALTWASWVLACRSDVQDKLREECEAVPEEQPSM